MVEAERPRWSRDKWDAIKAGAVSAESFRQFDKAAAGACLKRQHVLILGESTTRDLFYEFSSHAGLKPPSGPCMNTGKNAPLCTRVLNGAEQTRISFQFLSAANASREVDATRGLLSERPADVVFVYCFMYDWYGTVNTAPGSSAMGEACMQLIDTAILRAHPRTPVYLLGPTYPPAWVSPYENRTRDDSTMARIFAAINGPAGIRCVRGAGAGGGGGSDYRVVSTRGIRGPLDRYNIVGHRKRDRIHPFGNAHAPTVQMMLNSICPAYPAAGRAGHDPAAAVEG